MINSRKDPHLAGTKHLKAFYAHDFALLGAVLGTIPARLRSE
jgi:hypothetical protein